MPISIDMSSETLTARPELVNLILKDGRLKLALLALILLVWTCIVRLPFLHIVNDDEAFFSVMATRWLRGELPYADSYDVKPPLLFILFGLAQMVFGASLATIKGLEIVFTTAGAFGLYHLIQHHGTQATARWAALLYPVYSLTLSGVNAPNTLLQAPFVIFAFQYLLDTTLTDKPARNLFLCGLMIGLAGMIKQTAIFEALALGGLTLWYFRAHNPAKHILLLIAGAALPVLVFAAYFTAMGHFRETFDAVVTQSLTRVNLDLPETKGKYLIGFTRFMPAIAPLSFLVGCAVMAWLRRGRLAAQMPPTLLNVAAIWFVASAAGVIAMHAMFSYYATTLIAPLLILSGAFVCHGTDLPGKFRPLALGAAAIAAAAFPLLIERNNLRISDLSGPDDFRAEQAAASQLKQLGIKDTDHLLVLKRGLFIYVLTGAQPAGRYYHNLHLMCPFPTPDVAPLSDAFAKRPKFVVMANPTIWRACETAQAHAAAEAALAAAYDLKAVTGGQWDRFYIYQLRR